MVDPKNALGEALTIPKIKLGQVIRNSEIKAEKHTFGRDSSQYYLYFVPSGAVKRRVIVYIHGGGWMAGSPNRYKYIGQKFADMGYHTISLGYRRTPRNRYPTQAEDVFRGYIKGLSLLEKKGVDTSRIVIVGSSAGGHLAGILTYDKEMQKKFGVDAGKIKGMVSLGGILSFGVEFAPTTQMLIEALFEKDYDRRLAEPISLVDGTEKTRVLCIHSKNDPISQVDNETHFVEKVNQLRKGYASSLIIEDENCFHSNLVMGVFFEDPEKSDPLKVLFRWIESLPNG